MAGTFLQSITGFLSKSGRKERGTRQISQQKTRRRSRLSQLQTLEKRQLLAAAVSASQHLDFFLVDTQSNEVLTAIYDGDSVPNDLVENRRISIVATPLQDTDPSEIGSVRIRTDDYAGRTDNRSPYSLFGDNNNPDGTNYRGSYSNFTGEIEITAEVFDSRRARGELLEEVAFTIDVQPDPTQLTIDPTNLPPEVLEANPGLVNAIPNDGISDRPAIDAALSFLQTQRQMGPQYLTSATLRLPAGTFHTDQSLLVNAEIDVVGAGRGVTFLTNTPDFVRTRQDITDNGREANKVARDGYLIDFDRDADGASLSDLTLHAPQLIGGVFVFRADDIEIHHTRFDSFLWSGLRTFSTVGSDIHSNTFFDAGGRKADADGNLGVTGGGIFANFANGSKVYDNTFIQSEDAEIRYFGIKGRKWTDSRIHHNTIGNHFSVELPFENDENVEIDHNHLSGVVSLPKSKGGITLEEGFSFHVHHNYFTDSYSIEGPRNHLIFDSNIFEFDVLDDGGTLFKNFDKKSTPGPVSFTNNLVVNPGRGVFGGDGVQNNITFSNNHIIANQTISARTSGLFSFQTVGREGDATDFETVIVRDNVIEVRDLPRPLLNRDGTEDAVIENNQLIGISDTADYANPKTGSPQGLQAPLVLSVGAFGRETIDSDEVIDRALSAVRPGTFDTDGDGVPDNKDPAPQDASNGLTRTLLPGETIGVNFDQPNGTNPLSAAVGFTGINVDPNAVDTFYAADPYGVLTSPNAAIQDGLLNVMTNNGDSFNSNNSSADDYGYLLDTGFAKTFVVQSTVVMPPGGLPQASSAAIGMTIGDGSQASYIKFSRAYGGGGNKFDVRWDNADTQADASPNSNARSQSITMSAAQAAADSYQLMLEVDRTDPQRIEVTPRAIALAADESPIGNEIIGQTFVVTGKVADAINGGSNLYRESNAQPATRGLFVGVYSTDFSDPFNKVPSFLARWSDLSVTSTDAPFDAFENGSDYLRVFLADADTNETLWELTQDANVPAWVTRDRNLTLYAIAQSPDKASEIGSVVLELGRTRKIENSNIYSLFGDRHGDFRNGRGIAPGQHTLGLTVFDQIKGQGATLESLELSFTIL